MTSPAPWRRFLAQFHGTALLVTAVVGSGVVATRRSPHDVGLQLRENATATAFALGALILMFRADLRRPRQPRRLGRRLAAGAPRRLPVR